MATIKYQITMDVDDVFEIKLLRRKFKATMRHFKAINKIRLEMAMIK